MESSSVEPVEPEPFTQEGEYDDEITLDFEEKKLYVPKNFLTVASPVFKAMFRNEFKENKEKRVQMTGKSYEDFLEFLLCIHPGFHKEIDKKNVLRIVPLADEYQETAAATKCKTVMKSAVSKALETAKSVYNREKQFRPLRECFNVLKSAISLNYTDISDFSVDVVAKFGHCLYIDVPYPREFYYLDKKTDYGNETYAEVRNECISSFASLPLEWRNKILLERIKMIDENELQR